MYYIIFIHNNKVTNISFSDGKKALNKYLQLSQKMNEIGRTEKGIFSVSISKDGSSKGRMLIKQ